jgi:hypothetical protein
MLLPLFFLPMDWERVLEEVAFTGLNGLSQAALRERLQVVFPDFLFDDVTWPLVWSRVCRQPSVQFLVSQFNFPVSPDDLE